METSFQQGNLLARPNAITYNVSLSMCYKRFGFTRTFFRWNPFGVILSHTITVFSPAIQIMMNVYAKSKVPDAASRAMEALTRMKTLSKEEGRQDCQPDVFTYTSLIDTVAKESSVESSKLAEQLLEELETDFRKTVDDALKPNIRTYTSVGGE
jgi:hypothetical protein